jgi:hypothetical protein
MSESKRVKQLVEDGVWEYLFGGVQHARDYLVRYHYSNNTVSRCSPAADVTVNYVTRKTTTMYIHSSN